jgi:hypothetical protein
MKDKYEVNRYTIKTQLYDLMIYSAVCLDPMGSCFDGLSVYFVFIFLHNRTLKFKTRKVFLYATHK